MLNGTTFSSASIWMQPHLLHTYSLHQRPDDAQFFRFFREISHHSFPSSVNRFGWFDTFEYFCFFFLFFSRWMKSESENTNETSASRLNTNESQSSRTSGKPWGILRRKENEKLENGRQFCARQRPFTWIVVRNSRSPPNITFIWLFFLSSRLLFLHFAKGATKKWNTFSSSEKSPFWCVFEMFATLTLLPYAQFRSMSFTTHTHTHTHSRTYTPIARTTRMQKLKDWILFVSKSWIRTLFSASLTTLNWIEEKHNGIGMIQIDDREFLNFVNEFPNRKNKKTKTTRQSDECDWNV